MRILLIKMSSLGDVFHTFPALTDAQAHIPDLEVDWVVEKAFSDIPTWHSAVKKVYPIELRKWRHSPFSETTRTEIKVFFEEINQTKYDLILDAQGLYKSLWVAKKIHGSVYGMDFSSVREPLVSLFYNHRVHIDKNQHAITRLRELFSKVLGYAIDLNSPLSYGLNTDSWIRPEVLPWQKEDYYVLLHGTTWETKCWPEDDWQALIQKICQAGYKVVLPWGTDEERKRSERLQLNSVGDVWVPSRKLGLNEMARILKSSKGVVSVDTGLSHVAAALGVPMVVLYRVTDPNRIGAIGQQVKHLESPVAKNYVKKFRSKKQEYDSLLGLSVNDVIKKII